VMDNDTARTIVDLAIEERKRWGKHFGVADLPPEFLDAVVVHVNHLKAQAQAAHEAAGKAGEVEALREQLTLANRQLGASKARETKLRNELAELQKDLNRSNA
jgi:hypothetical protein